MAMEHMTLFFPNKNNRKEFKILAVGVKASKVFESHQLENNQRVEFHCDEGGGSHIRRVLTRAREK